MKKLSKVILGLLVVLTIVLIPKVSVSASNDNKPETVVLSENNLLVLNTEVNGESTAAIIAKAKELDAKLAKREYLGAKKPLYLFLNSPGGSIQSGLELIEALQGIGRPVNTVILFAASMAWQLAQNLDDRLILKNGVLMSHHAAGEMQGSFGGVHPSQMDNRYELWLDRVKELDEQTVKRTNGKQTYESYTKQYDQEMWLTGTKSVAQGYADKVVLVKCDTTLSGATTNHASILGFDISYDLDKCPINTSPMNIKVGSLDTKTVTAELTNKIKSEFLSTFENKQKQVLPMSF
jgi:ATP-dependent Clp protease protease subunit